MVKKIMFSLIILAALSGVLLCWEMFIEKVIPNSGILAFLASGIVGGLLWSMFNSPAQIRKRKKKGATF